MEGRPTDITPLVEGLWRRLRDVLLVAERVDTFAFGPTDEGSQRIVLSEADAETVARDFAVRALRLASDATNWAILSAAAGDEEGVEIDIVASRVGVPRLVVTERVAELLQTGLLVRAIDGDRIVATDAGVALVAMIDSIGDELAARLVKARGEGARGRDGLPLV